jgi:hypothetical protein
MKSERSAEFIVKRARRHVVFFGKPIDPVRAGNARDFLDLFYELCPNALAACVSHESE